ncbi:hypothetical protein DFQ28_001949 [Apophysomyces sp. BC1034]|nr:hypothetical protein DFQ30_002328 [Apophysomyces sp. BC1015]KAG0179981.1 hypothetical protein DFQ29_001426 [Apophysomyces sp. BC1021]KAG0190510.1 hypothetical protein DFQ28_001949 [Apophysomyces sp. BC1034]
MPLLKTFLHEHSLSQYYDAFIKAGATDQDLPQLLHFNDEELAEFLQAVEMLPFHAIKLKKGLRELRTQENNPIHDTPSEYTLPSLPVFLSNDGGTPTASREVIMSHATIYGKNASRPLTSYEVAINKASIELALETPMLLVHKGRLFELAKKKLLEQGYRYKRGRSRSKLSSVQPEDDQAKEVLYIKRKENAQRLSDERLSKIDHLEQQVQETTARRDQHEHVLQYARKRNDTDEEKSIEIALLQLESTRSDLKKEISKLKAQERKHQWYKKRKTDRSDSGFSEEGFSSQQSNTDNENEDRVRRWAGSFSSSQESGIFADEEISITSSTSSGITPRESDVRGHAITQEHSL